MHRTLLFAGLALALTALPASAQMITISPQQIGQIFCISRLGNDMAPVTGLLTPALTRAIADADKKNAEWGAANPGEKPPLGDGIPWQAWPDYASKCTVGHVESVMDEAWVEIAYAFPDYPDANFTAKLHLFQVDDPEVGEPVWRIDNIEYSEGSDLKAELIAAFDF